MAHKVLIVEDDALLARGLEVKLKHEGLFTTITVDGEEALKALEENDFDVILLDLVMPTMDGFQVLEALQKAGKKPTVFVLTNLSQHEDEVRARALGAKRFFIKSDTSLNKIVEAVKAV